MIEATFKDGRKVKYNKSAMDGMMTDADVIKVIDLETGEVLIDRNLLFNDIATLAIIIKLLPAIVRMNRVSLMSMIGMILDSYGAQNNYTSAETILLLEELLSVQKNVQSKLGMMPWLK